MKTSSYPGRFIAFDGLDGSGQSTQVALLRDFLSGKGIEVITTKEPTSDSSVAGRIRIVLDGEEALDSLELQRLFAKDREEHLISIVIPALEKGIWVITDRYALTSFAFSEAGGLNLKEVVGWHEDVLSPDITFFLRVSPVVAVRRLEARGRKRTLFEVQGRMEKNAEGFLRVAEEFANIVAIDGEQSIEKVAEDIRVSVAERFSI